MILKELDAIMKISDSIKIAQIKHENNLNQIEACQEKIRENQMKDNIKIEELKIRISKAEDNIKEFLKKN